MSKIEYFKFVIYDQQGRWGDILARGKYVFANKDGKIEPHNVLSSLIFEYFASSDLDKLEKFFLDQGFIAVPADKFDPQLSVYVIGLRLNDFNLRRFDEKTAKEYINRYFPNLSDEKTGSIQKK